MDAMYVTSGAGQFVPVSKEQFLYTARFTLILTAHDAEEEHGETQSLTAGLDVVEDLGNTRADVEEAACVAQHLRLPLELNITRRPVISCRMVVGERPGGDARDGHQGEEKRVREVGGEDGHDLRWCFQEKGLRLGVLDGLPAKVAVVVDLVEEDEVADRVLWRQHKW
jgi:hypothetical protein